MWLLPASHCSTMWSLSAIHNNITWLLSTNGHVNMRLQSTNCDKIVWSRQNNVMSGTVMTTPDGFSASHKRIIWTCFLWSIRQRHGATLGPKLPSKMKFDPCMPTSLISRLTVSDKFSSQESSVPKQKNATAAAACVADPVNRLPTYFV